MIFKMQDGIFAKAGGTRTGKQVTEAVDIDHTEQFIRPVRLIKPVCLDRFVCTPVFACQLCRQPCMENVSP